MNIPSAKPERKYSLIVYDCSGCLGVHISEPGESYQENLRTVNSHKRDIFLAREELDITQYITALRVLNPFQFRPITKKVSEKVDGLRLRLNGNNGMGD